MQCGAPVIVGNRTSLPEVVGDAGLLVDPFDVEAIADALARVIDDASLRAEMRRKGLAQAKKFSWSRTAQLTLESYERAVYHTNGA